MMRYIQVYKQSIEELNILFDTNQYQIVFNNFSNFPNQIDQFMIDYNKVISFFEPLILSKSLIINIYSKLVKDIDDDNNSVRYYFVTNYSQYIDYKLVYMYFDKNSIVHNRYQFEKVEFQNLSDPKNLNFGSLIYINEVDSGKKTIPKNLVFQNDSVFGYAKACDGIIKPLYDSYYPKSICKTCKFFNGHYSHLQCPINPSLDTLLCLECQDYEHDEFKSLVNIY
jgi:hypothetical protein